jgi:tetratricopeptide (TPR) repeat protein
MRSKLPAGAREAADPRGYMKLEKGKSEQMNNSGAIVRPVAIALALTAGAVVPDDLAAQEAEQEDQCRLVSNAQTEGAVEKLTTAGETPDPEAQRALFAEALSDLESQIQDDGDPTALWLAAEANIGLGEFEAADALLIRFVGTNPACQERSDNSRFNAWATAYNDAIQHYQAGDMEGALASFLSANTIKKDSRAFNNAGLLYQNLGDQEAAIEQFRGAVEADDPSDQARDASLNLAEALRSAGRSPEAIEMLRLFAEAHPNDVMAEMNYAVALTIEGDPAAAQPTFTKLLSRDDLTVDQWNQVGVGLYEAESFGDAVTAFQKARALNPYDRDALNNLATSALEAGEVELAAELSGLLVERYPYDFDAYTLLANTASRTENAVLALQVIQERGGLAFSLENVQLRERGDNAYVVEGLVMGRSEEAGGQVTVPIEFLDHQGEVAATEQLQLVIPANGETEIFQVEMTSGVPIAGFRFQKVASG